MKLKVCGLNVVGNIARIVSLKPDFVGFIFYGGSPRNIVFSPEDIEKLDFEDVKKVGVFVNETTEEVTRLVNAFKLDFVQLHGKESPEYCNNLKGLGVNVIKAFSVGDNFNMENTNEYQNCDFLLFDTKGDQAGGNGKSFDWDILKGYQGTVPFLLSGGLELKHANSVNELRKNHPFLVGLDINSKFEIKPGLKDVNQIEEFINKIKTFNHV